MKQWIRTHMLLISVALVAAILPPVLLAIIFAPSHAENGAFTWQYMCFILRSEWSVICTFLIGVEGLIFSVYFLRSPQQSYFSDSKTKKSIVLVFLILQFLLLLGTAIIPYILSELTPRHGLFVLRGFILYFLQFLCFSPELIAVEALVFFAYFMKSPLKKKKAMLAIHIVNALIAIAIFVWTMLQGDMLLWIGNCVSALVILILWIVEFNMRRSMRFREATAGNMDFLFHPWG